MACCETLECYMDWNLLTRMKGEMFRSGRLYNKRDDDDDDDDGDEEYDAEQILVNNLMWLEG